MASGHARRINRPNTWLLRPGLRREESPCQHGAVHTWHKAEDLLHCRNSFRFLRTFCRGCKAACMTYDDLNLTVPSSVNGAFATKSGGAP